MSADETGLFALVPFQEKDPDLSEEQRKLRQKFVMEYLRDFNEVSACIRLGYSDHYARHYARQFMAESFTQFLLQRAMEAEAESEKDETAQSKRKIRQLLMKEATYYGPGSSQSARVAALKALTELYGMEAPKKTEMDIVHRGNVMAVPGIASFDEWQDAARDSQKKLRTDVRH